MEGHSSLENEIALISADPFVATWLDTREDRSERVVLEANTDHWNRERGPRLERVVFRNDLSRAEALDSVCSTEGEVDIVSEVLPEDTERVQSSEHAQLEVVDAMRTLVGLINRGAEGAPLDDARARRALNLAVDRDRIVREQFSGYAHPLAGLTPHYATGYPEGQEPYPHDPQEAKRLMAEAEWPEGRQLRVACDSSLQSVTEAVARDMRQALGIGVEVEVIPDEDLQAAQRKLVEKTMSLPFDVLLHAWFDLTSDAPPAVMHREYYHSGGALRAGPPIPEFDELLGRYASQIDPEMLNGLAEDIDRYVYEEALSVFLCAPQALYAVNRHVDFVGHAATLELAETEVNDSHWSRRESSV